MDGPSIATVLVALIAGIPAMLTALAVYRQGMAAKKSADDAKTAAVHAEAGVKANDVKTDVLLAKTEEIHILTNSNLTALKAELSMANEHIKELQALVAKLAGGVGAQLAIGTVTTIEKTTEPLDER